ELPFEIYGLEHRQSAYSFVLLACRRARRRSTRACLRFETYFRVGRGLADHRPRQGNDQTPLETSCLIARVSPRGSPLPTHNKVRNGTKPEAHDLVTGFPA